MTDWPTILKLVAILAAVLVGMALGGLWRQTDMKEGDRQLGWLLFGSGAACGAILACAILALGNCVDWRVGDEGLEPMRPVYIEDVRDTVWVRTDSVYVDTLVGTPPIELDTLGTLEALEGRYYLVKEVEGE